LVQLVRQEYKAKLEQLVLVDLLVQPAHKDHKDHKDQQVQVAYKAKLEQLVQAAS
jgi:hypothetical protein